MMGSYSASVWRSVWEGQREKGIWNLLSEGFHPSWRYRHGGVRQRHLTLPQAIRQWPELEPRSSPSEACPSDASTTAPNCPTASPQQHQLRACTPNRSLLRIFYTQTTTVIGRSQFRSFKDTNGCFTFGIAWKSSFEIYDFILVNSENVKMMLMTETSK